MEKQVLFFPEGHQSHQLFGHPERPERITAISKGLQELGIWDEIPQVLPLAVDQEVLNAVHAADYLGELKDACQQGAMLDPDTYTTRSSWQLALNAAGGAAAVAEAVWDGKAHSGFALTRPPGHHATHQRGMGFCLINNIAVAAEYLLSARGARRLAILDLDLHHGNGTQDIFWTRPEVGFCSIHQSPFYPGSGYLEERGAGEGEGSKMNLPIPGYSGDAAYLTLLGEMVMPFLSRLEPEMLLISFGFDTHWRDPLGSMQVSAGCIYQIIKDLKDWTGENCGGKLAVILEGGYDLEAGRACGQAIAAALSDLDWEDPLGPSPMGERDAWLSTLEQAHRIWGF